MRREATGQTIFLGAFLLRLCAFNIKAALGRKIACLNEHTVLTIIVDKNKVLDYQRGYGVATSAGGSAHEPPIAIHSLLSFPNLPTFSFRRFLCGGIHQLDFFFVFSKRRKQQRKSNPFVRFLPEGRKVYLTSVICSWE